jgi:hypothetical protein
MRNGLRAIGAVLLIIFALPIALVAGLRQTFMGGANTSPEELAAMLRGIAGGSGDYDGDWDELDSVSLRDVRLEAIRREACTVSLPLTSEGRSKMVELAERAEAFIQTPTTIERK